MATKLCDICLESAKNVEVVAYCKDCPKYLCFDCTEKHKFFKPTSNHVVFSLVPVSEKSLYEKSEKWGNEGTKRIERDQLLAQETQMKEDKQLKDIKEREGAYGSLEIVEMTPDKALNLLEMLCEPCSNQGESTPGTSVCKQCTEALCHNCTTQHQSQKIFRNHEFVDVWKLFSQDVRCEPCFARDKSVPALYVCTVCVERYCLSCKTYHISQQLSRNHTCTQILQHLLATYKEDIDCGPCKYQGVSAVAVGYCTDCEDPDPLCITCIRQHGAQKMTRSHKISKSTPRMESTKPAYTEDKILDCGPCKYQGLFVAAVGYCTDCEVPDPLCTTCIRQHGAQKITHSHKISTDIYKLKAKIESNDPSFANEIVTNLNLAQVDVSRQRMMEQEKNEREQSETCSKPTAAEIKQNSIRLNWEHPKNKSKMSIDQYQIRYKIKNGRNKQKWKSIVSESNRNNFDVSGLRSNTAYEFQVRPIYDGGEEGPYSIVSDPVKTPLSLASKMLDFCTRIQASAHDKVAVYHLNTTELKDSRNTTAKTRKVVLGEETRYITKEITMMLVGATGSGKRTLVDGLVNYLMGVSFDDPFRFKLVSLEEEEQRQSNQALSQTEWITTYTIYPLKGGRHDFKINIIDTPGFGDTRVVQRDTDIVRQIEALFSEDCPKGVAFIDAVCFVVKAPDARLTDTQKYIFHSIMSLFGNDISKNICTLITFADGEIPPVLSALQESELPFGDWFPFNNSGLFVQNQNLSSSTLASMFWTMGHKSFKSLFEHIGIFETQNLKLTNEIHEKKVYLQSIIDNLELKSMQRV